MLGVWRTAAEGEAPCLWAPVALGLVGWLVPRLLGVLRWRDLESGVRFATVRLSRVCSCAFDSSGLRKDLECSHGSERWFWIVPLHTEAQSTSYENKLAVAEALQFISEPSFRQGLMEGIECSVGRKLGLRSMCVHLARC